MNIFYQWVLLIANDSSRGLSEAVDRFLCRYVLVWCRVGGPKWLGGLTRGGSGVGFSARVFDVVGHQVPGCQLFSTPNKALIGPWSFFGWSLLPWRARWFCAGMWKFFRGNRGPKHMGGLGTAGNRLEIFSQFFQDSLRQFSKSQFFIFANKVVMRAEKLFKVSCGSFPNARVLFRQICILPSSQFFDRPFNGVVLFISRKLPDFSYGILDTAGGRSWPKALTVFSSRQL